MNIDHGKREWTGEEIDGVREAVEDLMRKEQLSQAEVSRRSQVAESTLSQFMSDKYKGKAYVVAADLSRWLDAHHRAKDFRRAAPPEPTFVQTPTATKIHAALMHAQLLDDTSVIVGPPGSGKTAAITQYAADNPRTYRVTASPAVSTASAVLQKLIEQYSPTHIRTERSLIARSNIVRMFLTKGSVLVVDEAQHLSASALEELRAIHDDKKCGLVLVGNASVLSRIGAQSKDPNYAQLFGRVGWYLKVTKGTAADTKAVLATMGVDAPDVLEVACDITKREDIRVAVKTVRSALMIANGSNENLEAKHIRAAYRQRSVEAAA